MSKKKVDSRVYFSFFLFTGFAGVFSLFTGAEAAVPSAPAGGKTFYQGEEIDLQVPCAQVSLEVDPTLTKGINQKGNLPKNMTLNVAKDEAQNRVLLKAGECVPNAHLSLQIPANFSVVYHDSPKASLQVKGDLASFEGSVVDGGNVSLGQVDSLDLKMTGNAKVSVDKLHRAAQLVIGDNGSFVAKDSDLSVLSIFGTAQSDVLLRSGHIATAHFTMADEAQAQIFAAVGHADVRTKDKGFVRLGDVAQAPEITDGSTVRKETAPAGSIVVSQPDTVIPPPPEDILGVADPVSPSAPAMPAAGSQNSATASQPALTGSDGRDDLQEDATMQPAPGVPVTATQPIATSEVPPVEKMQSPVPPEVIQKDQKALKEEIKKEKAEQKAAKKDGKRMDSLATASSTSSSSLMVS